MKPSLSAKLTQLTSRLEELNGLLAAEDVTRDLDRYRALSREHAEIAPIVALYREWLQGERDFATAQDMLSDPETRSFGDDEAKAARVRMSALEDELQRVLLPRDVNDERNVFLEIRAGTGGDESALFAGELFRMYVRFAERNKWQVELISESPGDMGGYKEVIARIVGQGVYAKLKFESGGHRVQRVPETEAQGRIHTSACTVAVLPEADPVADITINPSEIRIDTFRASGAGGQHVNKTDSAVRITHLPSGIVVSVQNERSQTANKETAMKILRSRLAEKAVEEREAELARERGGVNMGFGGNAVRSYVLHPYQLVKDHRTDFEMGNEQGVLDGDLDGFIRAYLLQAAGNGG
jgi:peptide chain release factor 1